MSPGGPPQPEAGPEERLAALRARLARGEALRGDLARQVFRAAADLDPTATEDTLGPLAGNGGLQLYRSLVQWAGLVRRERVVDVGCGSGGASRAAAEAVGDEGIVVGVDPSPAAVRAAQARTPIDLPVVYVEGVAERLSMVPDRGADCVVASLVLDQIDDLAPFAREVHRVLRPGGRMVASVMDWDQLRPADARLHGAVLAVLARHARGALAGLAVRPTVPRGRAEAAAFRGAGLASVEERDGQLVAELPDVAAALRLYGRSVTGLLLGEEGLRELATAVARHVPHTLYLPVRLLRTRRPG
ncbi:MAG TPA: methyltransferase domain-containing protein [Miltoncostaeaceae bacterium]|nr:methyltransferase domain-containing protein [Miltoncostaeaceae bacterium]